MSIFPATDIVSDVARAADPARVKLAIKRLEDMGGDKARPADLNFSVARAAASPPPHKVGAVTTIDTSAPTAARTETLSPTQKFEAFLLQGWLEALLPKEGSGIYGNGAGADVWRSMMAEQLSTQIVRAGGVGLNRVLTHKNSSVAV
jgi:peptidoglycan hydrolase FlgJ